MNLGFHCILSIICIHLIQSRNCLRPSVNIACPKFNPSVPALVHHVFMCTFKDSINLKTHLFLAAVGILIQKSLKGWRNMSQVTDRWPYMTIMKCLFFFKFNKDCVLIVRDVKETKWLSLLLRICNRFQYFFEVEKRKRTASVACTDQQMKRWFVYYSATLTLVEL
jgi:hypothetical protein